MHAAEVGPTSWVGKLSDEQVAGINATRLEKKKQPPQSTNTGPGVMYLTHGANKDG